MKVTVEYVQDGKQYTVQAVLDENSSLQTPEIELTNHDGHKLPEIEATNYFKVDFIPPIRQLLFNVKGCCLAENFTITVLEPPEEKLEPVRAERERIIAKLRYFGLFSAVDLIRNEDHA